MHLAQRVSGKPWLRRNRRLHPQRSVLMLMIDFILMLQTLTGYAELASKILFTIHF